MSVVDSIVCAMLMTVVKIKHCERLIVIKPLCAAVSVITHGMFAMDSKVLNYLQVLIQNDQMMFTMLSSFVVQYNNIILMSNEAMN